MRGGGAISDSGVNNENYDRQRRENIVWNFLWLQFVLPKQRQKQRLEAPKAREKVADFAKEALGRHRLMAKDVHWLRLTYLH